MPADSTKLRNTILAIATPVAVIAIGLGAYLADRVTSSELERAATERLRGVTRRAAMTVTRYITRSQNQLTILARGPAVIAAARDVGRETERTGLTRLTDEELERRFATNRVLRSDVDLRRFLESFQADSDLVEVSFTERNGLNVAATTLTPRFVQTGEAWWQEAFAGGSYIGSPQCDEACTATEIELAARIDDPSTGDRLGVVRGVVRLRGLAHLVAAVDETGGAIVEVTDSTGRVLLSRDRSELLRPSSTADLLVRRQSLDVRRVEIPGEGDHLVAITPANRGRWWVVARQPTDSAFGLVRSIRGILFTAAGTILVAVTLVLWLFANWLDKRVTEPVQVAAAVTERVAGGDLTVSVGRGQIGTSEVNQLLQSLRGMVTELRKLVTGIRGSSEELAAMAQQISASTEQMSASTQEMAATSQRLSDQSNSQADQVRQAATDAQRILKITTSLAEGSQLASERSAQLKEDANRHRKDLQAGSERLGHLAREIEQGAEDAHRLAGLSTEIQKFVTQAKTIAKQTNMLALNAAIEAARAGEEGRGFGVVADEVRKLANQAAQSATATSETVDSVLEGIQSTHDRLSSLVQESGTVRKIAEAAALGLQDVTSRATENSAWANEISTAASDARHLVDEITQRLRAIAESTESFVAAVEQIAASAQEQSASTEEIASSAAHLAEASEKLNAGVTRFRLLDHTGPGD